MTLGLDLSDGHARAVIVDDQAQLLARGDHPIADRPAAAAAAAVRDALAAARVPVSRAGIAVPVSHDGLPAALQQLHRELLPDAAAPTLIGSGAAAVAAEQWCGGARGLADVVTLFAGDHVTSGIMLEQRIWRGSHGLAGAVGWLSLNPVEREDYRRLGGLEAEVSSGGIVRRVIWRIKSGDHSQVAQQHRGDLSRITVEQVLHCARAGDGLCVSVIRDTAKYIAMAVSNLAAILDPEAIVLGGLVASADDLLLEPIRQECSRRLGHAQLERLQIVLSPLGADAVAIGAARLAGAGA